MNYWKKQRMVGMVKEHLTVSNVLLCIQLLVFILMTFSGGSTSTTNLIRFGAKFGPYIQAGEYWRLVNPMFIHIGLEHIAVNSVMLFVIGNEIEKTIGSWRYTTIYLLSGIMGNLASFAFNTAISAGASTALFGLFGTIIYLSHKHGYIRSFQRMGAMYGAAIIINIVMGFINPGVDNFGHFGGLIGGYLLATAVSFRGDRESTTIQRGIGLLAYIILSVVLFTLGMNGNFAIF